MNTFILVYTTAPDSAVAELISNALVSEKLAACVSVLPNITSTYEWQGQLEVSNEVLLMIKTQESCYKQLEQRVLALHPYELPELIAVPIKAGLAPYLNWIEQQTC